MSDIVTRAILKDEMSAQLSKIKNEFEKTSKGASKLNKDSEGLSKGFKGLFNSSSMLKAGLGALAVAGLGSFAKSLVSAASEMETLETKFKVLLGDTESAKARMQELSKFASTTPFQLNQIANASRILQTLGGTALATGDSLRMVGDASAISGESFENLAMHVGRAYNSLNANRPIGESLMRLQELGLLSGDARTEIEKLQQSAQGKKAWQVLKSELMKTEGGMKELSKTFGGLTSTLKDQFSEALRQIANSGLFDSIKRGLADTVKGMSNLLESGFFAQLGAGFQMVKAGFKSIWNVIDFGVSTAIVSLSKLYEYLLAGLNWALSKVPDALVPKGWKESLRQVEMSLDKFSSKMVVGMDETVESLKKNMIEASDSFDKMIDGIPTKKYEEKVKETNKNVNESNKNSTNEWSLNFSTKAEIMRGYQDDYETFLKEQADAEKLAKDEQAKLDEKALKEKEEREKYYTDLLKREADHRKAIRMGELNLAMALTSSLSTISSNALGTSRKNAKARKTIALGEAIINTGLGVTKALASSAPPLNFINAGIVGAQGGAQISTIASQKFAQGGIVKAESGVPNIGDKTLVRVNAGEGVFTRDQMKALGGMMGTNNISPTLVVNGNVDSSTVPKLNDSLQSFADRIISAIRGNELDLVNELNLVTQ